MRRKSHKQSKASFLPLGLRKRNGRNTPHSFDVMISSSHTARKSSRELRYLCPEGATRNKERTASRDRSIPDGCLTQGRRKGCKASLLNTSPGAQTLHPALVPTHKKPSFLYSLCLMRSSLGASSLASSRRGILLPRLLELLARLVPLAPIFRRLLSPFLHALLPPSALQQPQVASMLHPPGRHSVVPVCTPLRC